MSLRVNWILRSNLWYISQSSYRGVIPCGVYWLVLEIISLIYHYACQVTADVPQLAGGRIIHCKSAWLDCSAALDVLAIL